MKKTYNISRRKFLELFTGSCCGFLASCSTVPITERKQLAIYPESFINKQAAGAYNNFKGKAKLIKDGKDLKNIIEIGGKIEKSVTSFFLKKDNIDPTKNFDWEYVLVDNKKVKNAWCMPGGKIAVYTGILDVAENDDGLATIMGHEIAHAVAKHSVERASRGVLIQTGTSIIDIATGGKLSTINRSTGMNTVGLLSQIGIMNPFNRKQESEADYLGLIFSSLSGFDIRETVKVWERMQEANKGKLPPEFLSTHPSPTNRIKKIDEWMNDIIIKYPPIT